MWVKFFFFLALTNATCSPFHQYTPKSVGCCLIVVASFFQDKRLSEVNSLFKEVDVRRKVRAHLLTSVCWMYYVYLKKQCESLVVIITPMVTMKFEVLDFPIRGSRCRYQNVKFKILFTYCTSKAWWNSYIFIIKSVLHISELIGLSSRPDLVILMCSWVGHLALAMPLSNYKWVLGCCH